MKRWALALALVVLAAFPARAVTFQPTVNPLLPVQNSPLASFPVRNNFQSIYNDEITLANLIGSGGGGGGAGTVTSVSCSPTAPVTCSINNQTTTPQIVVGFPINGSSNGNVQMSLGATTSGHAPVFDVNGNIVDSGGTGGGSVTWPTSGTIVVSNGTDSPAGLAEVDGSCAVGSAGSWVAGSCGSGSGVSLSNTTSNVAYPIGFTTTTSGSLSTLFGSSAITVNPSTSTITATNFAGKSTTATTATNATNTALLNSTSNVSYFLNFTTTTVGNLPTYATPGVTVNASTSTLSFANAALSGTVTAANVSYSGVLTGVSAALSGTITAANVSTGGTFTGVNEALSGTITAANVSTSGAFTGVSAALSGTATVANLNFTGALTGGNSALSGTSTFNNVTVTGTCTGCGGGGGGGTGTTGQVGYFSGTNTLTGSTVLFQSTTGYVGISTTAPAIPLDINGGAYSRVVAGGTQSSAGTYTPDFSASNSVTLTFGAGNFTIANPTHIVAGLNYIIGLTQDAVGGRTITWGSDFKWGGGTAPTLSTAAAAKDIISCWADTTSTLECTLAIVNAK